MHKRHMHPTLLDGEQSRPDRKLRWSEEETLMLARKEARLFVSGPPQFMNQELLEYFPTRTLEAIKGQRRKQVHKDNVLKFIEEFRSLPAASGAASPSSSPSSGGSVSSSDHSGSPEPPNSPNPSDGEPANDDPTDPFIEFALSINLEGIHGFKVDDLISILHNALNRGKAATLQELALYLYSVFPPSQPGAPRLRTAPVAPLSRRKQRRKDYAVVQQNWRKHQARCAKSILDGPVEADLPPREVMEPYWRQVMESQNLSEPRQDDTLRQDLQDIWVPVTLEDLADHRPELSSSPGPDGVTSRQIRALPNQILLIVFNIILWARHLPLSLRESRTSFIPKKSGASEPQDFRPITVPSVFVRTLHSVLAARIRKAVQFDPRQRAFMPTDGCADNTVLLDMIIKQQYRNFTRSYIAILDVAKAFDSVSHRAIAVILRSYGFPEGFIQYVSNSYNEARTSFKGDGWFVHNVRPARGVKQGDPMSPILFNLVIDRLLRSLPAHIGARLDGVPVNAIAFADDMVLMASTPAGLQELLDVLTAYLSSCGMSLNPAKCLSLSLKGQPKSKTLVVEHRSFNIDGTRFPFIQRGESWKYLGIIFDANGRTRFRADEVVRPLLDRITKAPLKPQQRLHILRCFLLPRLFHRLTLGGVTVSVLKKTDVLVRSAVRRWLHLPADVPTAFYHASVADGGLGIQAVRFTAPLLRRSRLLNLHTPVLQNSPSLVAYVSSEIDLAERRLIIDASPLQCKVDVQRMWSRRLYTSVDGSGLVDAGKFPATHRWISEPTRFLSGHDFINCIAIRINAMPTRSRTSRGRAAKDRQCRAGCAGPETLNHVLQRCPRTHGLRIRRHDAVSAYIRRGLENKGFDVHSEPKVRCEGSVLKPDLVAIKDGHTFVLDTQVVTDGISLTTAHNTKRAKYNTLPFKAALTSLFPSRTVHVLTFTCNWRGVVSAASVHELLAHKILSKSDLYVLSTRVLVGGIIAFRSFCKDTSVWRRRPPR